MVIALDSNVFIAYLTRDDVFFESSDAVIHQITNKALEAVCSSIVFGEIVYTTRDTKSLLAVDAFFHQLTGCSDRPADKIVCQQAARLRQKYPALRLPDALHLATAMIAKADNFITADKRLLAIAKQEITSTYLPDF